MYDVILTPHNGTIQAFEQIFADFGLLLNYKMEITPKTMIEIAYNTQEIILKQIFSKILLLSGPMTSS